MPDVPPPKAEGFGACARHSLPAWFPPGEALARMGGGNGFLLEGDAGPAQLGRWSLLGSHPVGRFVSRDGNNRFHWMSRGQVFTWREEALPALRRVLAAFPAPEPSGLPFAGGAVGVLSYELGRRLLLLRPMAEDDLDLPEASFLIVDRFLLFDHKDNRVEAVGYAAADSPKEARALAAEKAALLADAQLAAPAASRAPIPPPGDAFPVEMTLPEGAYRSAVTHCREEILEGEAYEICLTGRFETTFDGDARDLYRELRRRSPAPFAAFLRLPEATLVGASPERFLRVDPDGRVQARPIKGTRPRGATPEEDRALRTELAASEKDRAENVMIVDLLRNDLSRVCRPGSVQVPSLFDIEEYATVFQMVSTVTGELESGRDLFDLLEAAFPGGSMTGAPKIAAMQIIEELEPKVRGYYSGALGTMSFDGGADLSIVIRTVQLLGGRALVGAGGAIVADSDPEQEWLEARHKAEAPLQALAAGCHGGRDKKRGPCGP